MLDIALKFLTDELKSYLNFNIRADSNSADVVNMSRLVDQEGKYAFAEGTIAATIINIEEERTFKSQLPDYTYRNGQHVVLEPEIKLNLHVMFAANFKRYDTALKYIAYVLTYFQSHHCFTPEEYPALDEQIGKLTMELQSLSYEQLNQVWAFIGGKQLLSVIYKVRMVVLQDEAQMAIQPPLAVIDTQIKSR